MKISLTERRKDAELFLNYKNNKDKQEKKVIL